MLSTWTLIKLFNTQTERSKNNLPRSHLRHVTYHNKQKGGGVITGQSPFLIIKEILNMKMLRIIVLSKILLLLAIKYQDPISEMINETKKKRGGG